MRASAPRSEAPILYLSRDKAEVPIPGSGRPLFRQARLARAVQQARVLVRFADDEAARREIRHSLQDFVDVVFRPRRVAQLSVARRQVDVLDEDGRGICRSAPMKSR